MREVYVGNGRTIQVEDNKELTFALDINKIDKHFQENPEQEIVVGATNDWFFTAKHIKNKTEWEEIKKGNEYILRASCWDRFSTKQGEDYTVEINKEHYNLAYMDGFQHGLSKTELWFPSLLTTIRKMKYEQIKKLQEELNPIIERYAKEGITQEVK